MEKTGVPRENHKPATLIAQVVVIQLPYDHDSPFSQLGVDQYYIGRFYMNLEFVLNWIQVFIRLE